MELNPEYATQQRKKKTDKEPWNGKDREQEQERAIESEREKERDGELKRIKQIQGHSKSFAEKWTRVK